MIYLTQILVLSNPLISCSGIRLSKLYDRYYNGMYKTVYFEVLFRSFIKTVEGETAGDLRSSSSVLAAMPSLSSLLLQQTKKAKTRQITTWNNPSLIKEDNWDPDCASEIFGSNELYQPPRLRLTTWMNPSTIWYPLITKPQWRNLCTSPNTIHKPRWQDQLSVSLCKLERFVRLKHLRPQRSYFPPFFLINHCYARMQRYYSTTWGRKSNI